MDGDILRGGIIGIYLDRYTVCDGCFHDGISGCQEITQEWMEPFRQDWVDAAYAALVDCGFDVMLDYSGYSVPLSYFLPAYQPLCGQIGSCPENYSWYTIEILDPIRAKMRKNIPIEVRSSARSLKRVTLIWMKGWLLRSSQGLLNIL